MFQPNIYKLFNNDLKNLNNNQLLLHWKTIGKKENRISNISEFFNKYPEFKIENYKNIYQELKKFDDLIIMSHYHHNSNINNLNIDNNEISKNNNKSEKNLNLINNINKNNIDLKNNYLYKYLNNYYIYEYKLAIIIIDDLFDDDINNLNYKYDIYFINNNKNNNTKYNNINLKFDINLIQEFIIIYIRIMMIM